MKLTIRKERRRKGEKALIEFRLDDKVSSLLGVCSSIGLAITQENESTLLQNSNKTQFKCENGRYIPVDFGGFYPFDPETMSATDLGRNLSRKLNCIQEAIEKEFPTVDESSTVGIGSGK